MEDREDSRAHAVLNEVGCGLIVCTGLGRLIYANSIASRCLDDARLLSLNDGHVRLAPRARGNLATALRCAVERGLRTLVELSRDGERLLAVVVPLRDTPPGTDVLVMFDTRSLGWDLGIELLGTAYGLTLAERRILAALVGEATPAEIARRQEISLATVRTHIASLRAKLGTRRIEGLLLRAASVPAVAGALRL
ncbi:MAG: helix-turn-helix transcriptional regulator [Betaproteobacteria bacterium]